MKKTPFLSYILAALLAFSGIEHVNAAAVLNKPGQRYEQGWNNNGGDCMEGVEVRAWGTVFAHGRIVGDSKIINGDLTLEDAYIQPWFGDETWTISGNSRLDLGTSEATLPWFILQDGSSLVIDNGAMRLGANQEYTLGGNLFGTADIYLYNNSRMHLNGNSLTNDVVMAEGGATLDLGRRSQDFELTVKGTGNTLENGTFIGTLTLERGSSLTFGKDLQVDWGSTNIVLEDGSTLEMAADGEKWVDDITRIQISGYSATIKNACIRICDGIYEIDDIVDKLQYDESSRFYLHKGTLRLHYQTPNLDIEVYGESNVLWGCTINTHVIVDPGGQLRLQGSRLEDDAFIEMGDNAWVLLDSDGGEIKSGATFSMGNGATLELALPAWEPLDSALIVNGTGNKLVGGTFTGSLTMKENSHLYFSSNIGVGRELGARSIVMEEGSTLELDIDAAWRDIDISKLTVHGDKATINNAFLHINDKTTYTLDNGVQNLRGNDQTWYTLGVESTLDLNNHPSNLGIVVCGACNTSIQNGEINTVTRIDPEGKLTLKNVTIGEGASFVMESNTELDLGGAQGIAWINPSEGATFTVKNGRVGLAGVDNEMTDYVLSFTQEGALSSIEGNSFTVNPEDNVSYATKNTTRFLSNDWELGENQKPADIDVTALGRFILGKLSEHIGDKTPVVKGNVKIEYIGPDREGVMEKDVDIYCQLVGNLQVVAKDGRVNAGILGEQKDNVNDTTSTGYVEAKQVYLSGFIGKSLTLKAANKGKDIAIQVEGNAIATESLLFDALVGDLFDAQVGDVYGNILFKSNLSAKSITMVGKQIKSSGLAGDATTAAGYVEFGECDIRSTDTIDINKAFRGLAGQDDSILTVKAGGNVTLNMVGTASAPLAGAIITSDAGSIGLQSFTGGLLRVTTPHTLTISGRVEATAGAAPSPIQTDNENAVALEGASVNVYSISAGNGSSNVHSTSGDIKIDWALSAKDTTTLESAANITVSGNVLGGNLTATAGQSITLQNIGTSENSVKDAVLTAGGDITASDFTGATLKASATGAVTISGNVAAEGNAELTGGSVDISGSLSSSGGNASIKSTAGDIKLGGTLSAKDTTTLESAANITGSESNVLGGNLTATAGQSITLQNIGTAGNAVGAAVLTAKNGDITASAFTGATLKASATGAVTISGNVAASGGNQWSPAGASDKYAVVLEGAGVGITGALSSSGGNAFIKSTKEDITINGALSAKDTATLESAANITVSGNVPGGNLKAAAVQSITLGNIGSTKQPAGNVALTAGGGITATSPVNAGKLTASAAGNVEMNDVTVGQEGSSIASTAGFVKLGTFTGQGAQISADNGAIQIGTVNGANNTLQAASMLQVETAVSGSGNSFLAGDSVTFAAAASNLGLSNAIVRAPKARWENGTTLSNVTVTGGSSPAKAPGLLLAAGDAGGAQVAVGGSLVLKDHSYVEGDVAIGVTNAKVTVADSTVTGTVRGSTTMAASGSDTQPIHLELNNGTIGNVGKLASLTSSGESSITGLTDALVIPTLTLNGGSLTLGQQAQESGSQSLASVSTLKVTQISELNSSLELDSDSTFDFYLSAENTATPLLTINGEFTSGSPFFTFLTINLEANVGVEGGMSYALISVADGQKPDFWNAFLQLTVNGLGATEDNLSWDNGILYYRNGTQLKTAVWAPTVSGHLWNTTDQNWTQDGHRYRYKDGVTVVFDDTAFQLAAYQGEVELMNNGGGFMPGDVQVENSQEHNYTFKGIGKIAGTTMLTKKGAGTLTIENANTYSGGTFINGGTLVMADARALGTGDVSIEGGTLQISHAGQTPGFGTVSLDGGTIKIINGAKAFNLYVDGTDNLLEGYANDAFTGNLTLLEKSSLVSNSALAGQNGPASIVLKDGSTLKLATGEGMNNWINDITNLHVEGVATMVDAYLRINPYTNGGMYTLDNGVQNLKGEGVTAYCLDGSTFNLNGNTTNLGIIVWNTQPNKDNTIMSGVVDTQVDIRQGSRLILEDVEIGANATFLMGDGAYLDMGGRFTKRARLSAFSFTGASATIDKGTLLVAAGESVQLNTELLGNATISLGTEANLDLNGHTLAGSRIELAEDSATVSGGKFSGDVTVKSGKTLRLGVDQSIAGVVTLEESTSTLSLGTGCSVEGAISGSGTIMKEGIGTAALSGNALQNFTGSLEVQGGILNLLNAASVNVQDVTIQYGALGVYSGESTDEAGEATLTIKGSKSLAAGPDAKLNANLVMERGSTLDVRYTNGAGLLMGSTVTLSTGMTLNDYSADWATWKDGTKYVLFTGVDGLSIGGDMMAGTLDYTQWVDAKEYFTNIKESNRYFLCYGGAPDPNAKGILTAVNDGSNVGMVYIMTMPEPTTSTLSLLALAALAARRRRK